LLFSRFFSLLGCCVCFSILKGCELGCLRYVHTCYEFRCVPSFFFLITPHPLQPRTKQTPTKTKQIQKQKPAIVCVPLPLDTFFPLFPSPLHRYVVCTPTVPHHSLDVVCFWSVYCFFSALLLGKNVIHTPERVVLFFLLLGHNPTTPTLTSPLIPPHSPFYVFVFFMPLSVARVHRVME
jgi:hypothetical protein